MEIDMNDSILPYENYVVIYKVSYVSLISAVYAYYQEGIHILALFITYICKHC